MWLLFYQMYFFKPGKSSCCRLQRCYKQASQWTAMLESVSEVSEKKCWSPALKGILVQWCGRLSQVGSQAWKRVAQSNVHRFDWKRTKEKEGSGYFDRHPITLLHWFPQAWWLKVLSFNRQTWRGNRKAGEPALMRIDCASGSRGGSLSSTPLPSYTCSTLFRSSRP